MPMLFSVSAELRLHSVLAVGAHFAGYVAGSDSAWFVDDDEDPLRRRGTCTFLFGASLLL
jgi:beta-glucosidase-like glycosyl hydrolase